jgi:hypothetical protein
MPTAQSSLSPSDQLSNLVDQLSDSAEKRSGDLAASQAFDYKHSGNGLSRIGEIRYTLAHVTTVAVAYFWLHSPMLQPYSLQVFALVVVAFFILKRIKQAKLWHLLPGTTSIEVILITFSFMLLIGATGNFNSPFYPLTFIHLFILVMTTPTMTAISVMLMVILFHYGLSPELLPAITNELISLPMFLIFFLFAKRQYDEAKAEKIIIKRDKFLLKGYLKPKLHALRQALPQEPVGCQIIESQLSQMEEEIDKNLEKMSPVK